MSRLVAYRVGLRLVALVASPRVRGPARGPHPPSTHPVFARDRGKASLYSAEGVDRNGRRLALPPALVAGPEVMQAAASVSQAVSAGEASVARLCAEVARRVARSAEHSEVRDVQIVSARYDPI